MAIRESDRVAQCFLAVFDERTEHLSRYVDRLGILNQRRLIDDMNDPQSRLLIFRKAYRFAQALHGCRTCTNRNQNSFIHARDLEDVKATGLAACPERAPG